MPDAAERQSVVDARTANFKNIQIVAHELKSRERCSFITMLKALMLRQIMMEDSVTDEEESTLATAGVKRKRSSASFPPSKKIKTDEPLSPLVLKEAQYERLSLFWYDSQGCIEADTINIIEELPLLVLMIWIFEDFPLGMWGYTPIDVWAEDENKTKVHYCRNEKPMASFQIINRRTFTADAIRIPAQTATPPTTATFTTTPSGQEHELPDQALFLKSSWSETRWLKEPEVVKIAYERARKYLGTEARSVTEHLPVIVNFQELAYTSTEIIRHLVKSTTTDGFRIQLWMLSMKLLPIHSLEPIDFWTAYWHTLCCHALLWRIGIAHGDVSLHSLMHKASNKYGVLNDFDVASVMDPGARNPNRQGLERTGTLPFMALELLRADGFEGKVPRRYEHELESFSWILVWVSRCVHNGQESRRPHHLEEWLGRNNVCRIKVEFIENQDWDPMSPDYGCLHQLLKTWVTENYQRLFRKRQSTQVAGDEKTDKEHLQALVALCMKCAEKDPFVAVPIDIGWIDGLADLNYPAAGHLPTFRPASSMAEAQIPLQRSGDGP
ncbi:hypothetical protein M413DRAFT_31540 [Hebeloma cylindrosporum]|uniref:Fungal-type protein kinase domain-containing protein n=1 Tax=Hebeloma cylindrosporum TaxID=76867 RepID=A0A0C3BJ35_HEBCY|nr:hypothetical protein M413DRAFT_31540 [Hebeloma cylindrosporum h7]